MDIKAQINRAVSHIIVGDYKNPTPIDKEKKCEEVYTQYTAGTFDFSKYDNMTLTQGSKKRIVKYYDDVYSTENILCQCVKQILDRIFKIKYPNRNKVMRSLFTYISAISQMSSFVIVKFDFKDYYNSVSSPYVFEKYIKKFVTDREELEFIRKFATETQYAYAGLPTSNVIAEIIASYFDDAVKQTFIDNGLLFYERYIDDCILILNDNCSKSRIELRLDEILNSIYNTPLTGTVLPCKVKYNKAKKFQYVSKKTLTVNPLFIDYLGYEFAFKLNTKGTVDITYGITKEKRDKYAKRIVRIVSLYNAKEIPEEYHNIELLRHRIRAFSSRSVYISKHFNSNVWKAKGFIANYGELRHLLDSGLIENNTEIFLKNMIKDAFITVGIAEPYFLKQDGYDLFNNMKENKTLLLVENIGYDHDSLIKMCKKLGIACKDAHGNKRNYSSLVREYLIKVKVGY